jgi:hypothetical protein
MLDLLVVIHQFNHRRLKTIQPLQDNLLDLVEFEVVLQFSEHHLCRLLKTLSSL